MFLSMVPRRKFKIWPWSLLTSTNKWLISFSNIGLMIFMFFPWFVLIILCFPNILYFISVAISLLWLSTATSVSTEITHILKMFSSLWLICSFKTLLAFCLESTVYLCYLFPIWLYLNILYIFLRTFYIYFLKQHVCWVGFSICK